MKKPSTTHIRSLTFALILVSLLPVPRSQAATLASITCEGLFSSSNGVPTRKSSIPGIVQEIGRRRLIETVTSRECEAFANACALSSITTGVEALEQFRGRNATPREILQSEALQNLKVIRGVTKKNDNGMTLGESLGLLRFQLARRGLIETTTVQADLVLEATDLVLAPNEMMLLATEAASDGHMVLMFQQDGHNVRAADPQTGRVENYKIITSARGSVQLVSTSNNGSTSVLDVFGAIRITPEKAERKAGPQNEMQQRTEMIVQQMRIFRSLIDDPYPLLPQAPKPLFKNLEDARAFVKEALARYDFARNVMTMDVTKLSDPNRAGLVFNLQLLVTDIEQRAEEVNFFVWLENHGLKTPSAKPVVLPKWDSKMLEARVSSTFKEARARATQNLENLLQKPTLSHGDLEFAIGRAAQAYSDLVMAAAKEVQPIDAHRLMTPYLERFEALMKSPQIEHARHQNATALFVELADSKIRQYRSGRKQIGLDGN